MGRGIAAIQLHFVVFISIGCASTATDDAAHAGSGGAAEAGANAAGSASETDEPGGADAGNSDDAGTADAGAGAGAADSDDAGAADAGAGGTGATGSYSLFNGVDFAEWDRYLGKPSDSEPALGIDNDPRAVYSIVERDGEPAIRISGEIWGALLSKREFCDFRLRAQFRWGSVVWTIKDSGIMFLSSGPLGAVNRGGSGLSDPIGSGAFMVSTEYQIAPGDVGSLYNLGPISFSQTLHNVNAEKPEDWNQVELSLQADVASLSLNGQEISRASGFLLAWPDQPASALRCGKLQLQSEGAEIFFRRLEIEALP